MSNVKDLIDAIADGSATGMESTFNVAMAEKLSGRLETMRQEVAQNLFTAQEAVVEEGKNWIAGAIKHPGSMTAAAKRAGESTSEYEQEHKHDSGKAGKRARLALTLKKLNK